MPAQSWLTASPQFSSGHLSSLIVCITPNPPLLLSRNGLGTHRGERPLYSQENKLRCCIWEGTQGYILKTRELTGKKDKIYIWKESQIHIWKERQSNTTDIWVFNLEWHGVLLNSGVLGCHSVGGSLGGDAALTWGQAAHGCNNDAEHREQARPYHQGAHSSEGKTLQHRSTNVCRGLAPGCASESLRRRKTVMPESQPAFWIRISSSDTTFTVKLSWSPQTTWLTHLGTWADVHAGFLSPTSFLMCPPALRVPLDSEPGESEKDTIIQLKGSLSPRKWLDFLN